MERKHTFWDLVLPSDEGATIHYDKDGLRIQTEKQLEELRKAEEAE